MSPNWLSWSSVRLVATILCWPCGGILVEAPAVELDGEQLIVEYDPEAGEIRAKPFNELKKGKHQWVVRVRDMSGNQREVRSVFDVIW